MTTPEPGTGPGPGASPVPRWGVVVFSIIVVTLGLVSLYSLWEFWPIGTQASGSAKQAVSWFGWHGNLNREFLFFLTVAIAGGVGGLIHTTRSFVTYVGHRKLLWSWIPYNLLLPVIGALAGTVFYLVLRAGLFSPSTSVQQASPFGFAAISILAGLFSPQAFEKLRALASQVFTEAPRGADSVVPASKEPEAEPPAGG
jgi:hypothetical protein